MSRQRWIILGVCLLGFLQATLLLRRSLLIPVLVGKILDVRGSFPAAFTACAASEASRW